MAYTSLALKDLTELKQRIGNVTDTTLASILGINYPLDEAYAVYAWYNTSTAVADDFEIVCPNSRIGMAGRWLRVDLAQLPQANADWTATTGVARILNKPTTLSGFGITDVYSKTASDSRYLQSFTEQDPTVPSHVKGIAATDIDNWNSAFSWGDHNAYGYLTENSYSHITNKTGNISQWTNDLGYSTGFTEMDFWNVFGYWPYPLDYNPLGYISDETDPTVPSHVKAITSGDVVTWNSKQNTIIAGNGIVKSGDTISVDGGQFMTMSAATQEISTMQNSINNKVPMSRTITLNNVTKPLTGDVVYNVAVPTDTNQLVNGAGFITGVTSGQIITALGYTPIDINTAKSGLTLTTTGTSGAATYNPLNGALNIPNYSGMSAATLTYNIPNRPLNTGYTISNKSARVFYTLAITTNINLLNLNSAGRVYLEYSTNSGTNWVTVNSAGVSKTLTVSITIGIQETTYWNVSGEIPPNALVRLRTTTSGGGTVAWDSGEETY